MTFSDPCMHALALLLQYSLLGLFVTLATGFTALQPTVGNPHHCHGANGCMGTHTGQAAEENLHTV